MDSSQDLLTLLVAPTSTAGILLRGAIWLVIAIVIIISSNRYNQKIDPTQVIKRRLGSLFLFMILGVGLMYLLFSYVPA
jgi:hypothetical protein